MSKQSEPPDDLAAVRAVTAALLPFESADQERIIRWAREKLGLSNVADATMRAKPPSPVANQSSSEPGEAAASRRDVKSFIAAKNPSSDTQFAAAAAYYYRFEAPEAERKESITAADLQDACRKAGRERLKRPIVTLHNAHKLGLLDKAGRGAFAINSVGENLVAMALPQADAAPVRRTALKRKPARRGKRRK